MGFVRFSLVFVLILVAAPVHPAEESGKSGVSPQVISLPDGPASIEGLGESFEPQLNTGTASYRVPLNAPKVRGIGPGLALEYNSGFGNGPAGMGWRLSIPYIQRQTDKGLPLYNDADTFIESGGEELVLTDPVGIYRCENESGFTQYRKETDGSWTARLKNGTTLRYGMDAASRQDRAPGQTFRWMISEIEDPNGNRIEYAYFHDLNQIYIDEIRYGGHATAPSDHLTVKFVYEDGRPDPAADYRGRFRCVTAKRLSAVTVRHGTRRIRHWALSYADGRHSMLAEIRVHGDQRADIGPAAQMNRDYLPPLRLGYTPDQTDAVPQLITATNAPLVSFNTGEAELVDLDFNGLPDILLDDQGEYKSALNKGQGKTWGPLQPFNFNPTPRLSAPTSRLIDPVGEGRSKLLVEDQLGFYYLPFDAPNAFGSDVAFPVPGNFPIDDPDARFVDINNDKAVDIMATDPDGFSFVINRADGTDNYLMDNPPSPPAPGIRFSGGWQLADMNGDRLQDLVVLGTVEEGGVMFHPSLGMGDFDARQSMTGGPSDADLGYAGLQRLFMSDVDQDGLADMVFVDSGVVRYWLNLNGEAWGPVRTVTENIPDYDPAVSAIRFADMNGNGSTDIVWNRADLGPDHALKYLDLMPGEKPFQLNRIENGIGRTIEIEYASSTDFMVADAGTADEWTSVIPFPVDVVRAYAVKDGMGGAYRTEIRYRNGYYDGKEKEFRGFEAVVKQEAGDDTAPDLFSAFQFHTGQGQDALKGKPLTLEARNDDGKVFFRESYAWEVRELAGGGVFFPYQREKVRDVIEKGAGDPVQLRWEFDFDDYGNMTRRKEHGRAGAEWDDERVTETVFTAAYPSGQDAWILDRPVERAVTDENGVRAAASRHFYDGSGVLGEVTKGNPTRTESWVAEGQWIVSSRSDFDVYGNVFAIYDPLYGQAPGHWRDMVYDPVFHAFPVSEQIHTGETTLTMSAQYDAALGVMTASTEFNGHTSTYEYDPFGRIVGVTRPPDAGRTVEYDYELAAPAAGGVLINWVETRQRDGSPGDGFLHARSFYDGLGRKIMTRAEGEEAGQVVVTDTVKFNARKGAWKKYLPYFETGTLDYVDPTYNTGFTEHSYDAMGREIRMNQPEAPEGVVFSQVAYGPLSRTVKDEEQTRPGSRHFGCGMRYVTDGLLDKDGKGRLREVYEIVKLTDLGKPLDAPVEKPWLTQYSYDLLDNLTGYVDSQNNQKMIEYDGLGRKTFMNDPDRGKMWYTYDDAGNLIETLDAKEQVIEYAYDGVNRLKAEYYGEGKSVPDVAYHYDFPAGPVYQGDYWRDAQARIIADAVLEEKPFDAANDVNLDGKLDAADVVRAASLGADGSEVSAENTLGMLAWVRDQSGEEHRSYDVRGRVSWVVKRIIGSHPDDLKNFYTGTEYDAMDRVSRLTYPDRTFVDYVYNNRGLVESIPDVVERMAYNPAGQNALMAYACGTVTTYDFDHRLRLSRLMTVRNRDALALQDLNYTYDGVSNIVHIRDGRGDATLDVIGAELGIESAEARKFDATQGFEYDSLYRLTRAANVDVYGEIAYRYDRIGNMISKNADLIEPDPMMDLGEMSYGGSEGAWDRVGRNANDPAGPHAVTNFIYWDGSSINLSHDKNGNIETYRKLEYNWDIKDRLTSVWKNANHITNSYDFNGLRVKRNTVAPNSAYKNGSAYYINKFSEIRKDTLIRYVFNGNYRIATLTSNYNAMYLVHDHLYSTTQVLDLNAYILKIESCYPFGIKRRTSALPNQSIEGYYSYTDKEKDDEAKLYYFFARYYNDEIISFLSPDKTVLKTRNSDIISAISNPQKLNLYSYTLNSPQKYIDEDGHAERSIVIPLNVKIKILGVGLGLACKPKITIEPLLRFSMESDLTFLLFSLSNEVSLDENGYFYQYLESGHGPFSEKITRSTDGVIKESFFELIDLSISLWAINFSIEIKVDESNLYVDGSIGSLIFELSDQFIAEGWGFSFGADDYEFEEPKPLLYDSEWDYRPYIHSSL